MSIAQAKFDMKVDISLRLALNPHLRNIHLTNLNIDLLLWT